MKQNEQTKLLGDITGFLQREVFSRLPDNLYYHNIDHTLQDVLPAAIRLAEMEAVSSDDLFLLKTAVLFHDTGFIKQYPNQILNVHPSLLPSFKGARGIKDAFTYGVKVTGVTIHFADDKMDHGPIIIQ